MKAYISIGSNIAARVHVPEAVMRLGARLGPCRASTFYWNDPFDRSAQPRFLNGVLEVAAAEDAQALQFEVLRPIEAALGRVRRADKSASRPIDLDLILYGDEVIATPDLTIPDPEIRRRPFLVLPLLELCPALVLPGTGMRLASCRRPEWDGLLEPDEELTQRIRSSLCAPHVTARATAGKERNEP